MLLTLIAVFVLVALLSGLALDWLLSRKAPLRRRFRELTERRPDEAVVERKPHFAWFGRARGVTPDAALASPRERNRTRRNLLVAGHTHPAAGTVYTAAELLLPVLAGGIVLLIMGTGTRTAWGVAAAAAVLSFFVPTLWLESRMAARRNQIRKGLADVLDLLIVCLEAGSSLDQAIMRASEDLDLAYPALAKELKLVSTEIRAGIPRLEAFHNFAHRTKVDEVRSLVGMLVQTDRFGTSISQALRVFASAQRVRRRQDAEERAGQVAVKLAFPLVFFMFPALYVIVLGSAMIQIYRSFGGHGGP